MRYDNSMELYVNCDKAKECLWRSLVSGRRDLAKGIVDSQWLRKAKVNEKFKTTAEPGELVLFVREKSMNGTDEGLSR